MRARALAGLTRYQDATRPTRPKAAKVHAVSGVARLLYYGSGESGGPPIVVIPSLINPPDVLDLSERISLMRWLATQGHDVFLVDWGHPDAADRSMNLSGHIITRLVPLLQTLEEKVPPVLVGYCLGGTLAAGAAACFPVSALVTIATPWDFDGFSDKVRQEIAHLWRDAKPFCQKAGYVPMEVLQSGFWALDPARTIAKYADFGEMQEGSDAMTAFMALEDWANAGPPLTYAASEELFEELYQANVTGLAQWKVGEDAVRPEQLTVPSLSIRSSTDRIVPATSAPALAESWTLDMGHVGMIVGSRARQQLWEPLSQWLFKHGAEC
ncbi:alpha/beta hydrolase [Sphingobium sp. SCG-1]|nr:alpha/beta hydrolase [Sphingobium sp. SCG-1]